MSQKRQISILLKEVKEDAYLWYEVRSPANKYLGELHKSEDGYYNFWPDPTLAGYYSQDLLLDLGEALTKLNLPWEEDIAEYFEKRDG